MLHGTSLVNKKSDGTVISSYSFTLDAIGNHTQANQDEPLLPQFAEQNLSYSYDVENRLTSVGGEALTYDGNGNLTAQGADVFVYDFDDRLTQSTIAGETTQYDYDGSGNRLRKVKGGVAIRYVLDISGTLSHVLAETDSNGAISAYYIYGMGLVSKVLPDGAAAYYHYDAIGNTVAVTDANQEIVAAYAYDIFGTVANSSGMLTNSFKHLGKHGVIDEGNGLEYVRARYYASELGRFITKDPLTGKDGDSQSLNRYIYALNNPVILIDISGLSPQEGVQKILSEEEKDAIKKWKKKLEKEKKAEAKRQKEMLKQMKIQAKQQSKTSYSGGSKSGTNRYNKCSESPWICSDSSDNYASIGNKLVSKDALISYNKNSPKVTRMLDDVVTVTGGAAFAYTAALSATSFLYDAAIDGFRIAILNIFMPNNGDILEMSGIRSGTFKDFRGLPEASARLLNANKAYNFEW